MAAMAAWRPGRLSIDVPVMMASSWMLSVICLMVMRKLAIKCAPSAG